MTQKPSISTKTTTAEEFEYIWIVCKELVSIGLTKLQKLVKIPIVGRLHKT